MNKEALAILESAEYKRADAFAEAKHAGQVRKGGKGIPYIVHPRAVAHMALANLNAEFVEKVAKGRELELYRVIAISAVLHDVLEDTKTSTAELEAMFGAEIVRLVRGLTLHKNSGHFEEGLYLYRILQDPLLVYLKVCDRIHNVDSYLDMGYIAFDYFMRLEMLYAYLIYENRVCDNFLVAKIIKQKEILNNLKKE